MSNFTKIIPLGAEFFSMRIDGQTDCDDAVFHSVCHTSACSCRQHDRLADSCNTDVVRAEVQIIVTEHLIR